MKFYSRNQLGIIFIIIVGIFYSFYLDNVYYETIKMNEANEYIVIQQNCNYSPKMISTIFIKKNNKQYSIKVDKKTCEKYPKNSKIKVFYNNNTDKFIYKVENYNGKNRLTLLIIILLISFLPWSLWISKLEKKQRKTFVNRNY